MTPLLVAADDRTGALEVAGACADEGRVGVVVQVGADGSWVTAAGDSPIVVVDLGSRHLGPIAAGAAAASIDVATRSGMVMAHKIDSTLRGNWAHELVARHRASGRRVLVVPAFPAVGRHCVGGAVTVHGVPVHESAAATDARGPVRSSRPGELLRAAGAVDVAEVEPGPRLAAWLSTGGAFAVCDAATEDDLAAIAAAWAGRALSVLFAGTAGSIGAAAGALARAGTTTRAEVDEIEPVLALPAVVVCGSLHPVARAQVRSLRAAGAVSMGDDAGAERTPIIVLTSPEPLHVPVSPVEATAAAVSLAREAKAAIATARPRTVVIIGGDTAAALLGDASVVVGGTVAAGMPWFRLAATDGPLFITKAGGFGGPDALTDLLLGTAVPQDDLMTTRPNSAPSTAPTSTAPTSTAPTSTARSSAVVPMAITMGDPSGIGPEIVLRRAADGLLGDDVVVYGDLAVLRRGAGLLGLDVPMAALAAGSPLTPGVLNVVDLAMMGADDLRPGVLDARSGAAARDYVLAATDDALAGRVAGLVTMPMNKEATQLSDPGFVGHTELIAHRCGAERVTMMLTNGPLAVTHVSTHCSLAEAISRVRTPRVLDVVRLTDAALRRFIERPRVAVCGLNPHAGEHGLFGTEDIDHIVPAIEQARSLGIDASGPHPADTVFYQAVHRHRYDAIVCMYHDQGHGPMKLLAFDTGVNVTLGLPIIRTSVDHGTAFDIAWQGIAFTDSLDHALRYAWKLAGRVETDADADEVVPA